MVYICIKLALFLIVGTLTFWYALRYNLHMLQLNTYINSEQSAWLKKNVNQLWTLYALSALGVLQASINNVVIDFITFLFLLLTCYVFKAYKRIFSKKPLHFTDRAKRIVITDVVISLILLILVVIDCITTLANCFDVATLSICVNKLCAYVVILAGLQFALLMVANFFNQPIEKHVRNHFINEAKEKLAARPDLTIIGVTGSYGKTSMKFYLQTLLQAKYNVLVTPESYNTPMGVVKTIREQLKSTHEVFICEMGARYVGEIKEICDIVHPDMGIITSIGPAHLETFGSIQNTQKTKFELADSLPEGSTILLNADSDLVVQESERRATQNIRQDINTVYYGTDKCLTKVDFKASDIKATSSGTSFTCNGVEFQTKLVGEHNVINIAGAIACASNLGIALDSLKIPIRRIMPVPHRLELKKLRDVTILDDAFNSNPAGSKAAVEALSMFEGVRILITPGMVELGDDEDTYNEKFGGYAASCCDWILLVGEEHTKPIKNGALSAGFDEKCLYVFSNFNDAYAFAMKIDASGLQKIILLENDLPDNY